MVNEPAPTAKVILYTSKGALDIEVWAKEMPEASRRFLQLCQDGYYDSTEFHTVAKSYVQAGPDDDTSVIKTETNTRLRFTRRGLVACAANRDGNSAQFIITLDALPQLNGQCTIFGRVVSDSIYNLAAIGEASSSVKITSARIITSYFELRKRATPPVPLAGDQPAPALAPKRQIRIYDEPVTFKKKRNPEFQTDPARVENVPAVKTQTQEQERPGAHVHAHVSRDAETLARLKDFSTRLAQQRNDSL